MGWTRINVRRTRVKVGQTRDGHVLAWDGHGMDMGRTWDGHGFTVRRTRVKVGQTRDGHALTWDEHGMNVGWTWLHRETDMG